MNALRETGIAIHRATREFAAQGRTYPAGSFVVWTAQSFRPHVLDMFEPQVHPDVFPYPGSPPTPPYDNAGWTLAFQMGVEFDRILDPVTIAGLEPVSVWNLPMPPGSIAGTGPGGYVMQRRENNAYIAANRLLKAGQIVRAMPGGALFVRGSPANRQVVERLASELGVNFERTNTVVPGNAPGLRPARIGLWDQYGGSMDAGWARWILEQFEFPFQRVFAPELDAGNLNAKFDVLVFVGGGIPAPSPRRGGGAQQQPIPDIPAEYQSHVGRVTAEQTLPRLKEFIEAGGTVVAIGESAPPLAAFLGLPIENHLVENGAPLPRTKLYVPGSLLTARVDTTRPLAAGMRPTSDFFFDDSPVFRLHPNSASLGVTPIAWLDSATPLRSGWAWGQQYLKDGVIAAEAKIGKGRAILYAPEILKRAQPHGTFKLLFNALYLGGL